MKFLDTLINLLGHLIVTVIGFTCILFFASQAWNFLIYLIQTF